MYSVRLDGNSTASDPTCHTPPHSARSHLDAHFGYSLDLHGACRRGVARRAATLDDGGELRVARVAVRLRHLGLLLGKKLEERDALAFIVDRLLELLIRRALLDEPRLLLLDLDERGHALLLHLVLAPLLLHPVDVVRRLLDDRLQRAARLGVLGLV